MRNSNASWVLLLALGASACATPGAPGQQGTASRSPLAEALEGCQAREGRLDVWCDDVVFVSFNRPGRTDVAQGMAALRSLIEEVPGTEVTVEPGPDEQQLRDIMLMRVDYRYTWEGKPYVARTFGRVTPEGSSITDCAAPADRPEAITRCENIARLVLTEPHEEVNRYVKLGDETPRPRPRFDDPARSCRKEERDGMVGYACKDGSGLLVLARQEGAPDSEHLTALLRERGVVEQGQESLCVVMDKPSRCQRYDCPGGCQLVVAPLNESPPGTAVCVIPPRQQDAPWICAPIFQVIPETITGEPR
ncbi:hypothetical protein ACN28E_54460 [Archangium lansingense]|uniref:hypothetical protein n=1 Tax=Archangium lansingense TaxID=2995310 RepID=UPI003B7B4BB1